VIPDAAAPERGRRQVLVDALQSILEYLHESITFAHFTDAWPELSQFPMELPHTHVSEPNVDDAGRGWLDQGALGKVCILLMMVMLRSRANFQT
jgi:hypothetical protein